jgi:beta-lactamase class A
MKRRDIIRGGFAAAVGSGGASALTTRILHAAESRGDAARFHEAVRRIERDSGGRLGVAILDMESGAAHAYRGAERFPMCSTFKFLAAAKVLLRVDQGEEQLSRRIGIQAADIVPHSPATKPRVGGAPMSVAELCEAAVTLSDNGAANVLLRSFGGPAALTAYARSLGDATTRLDRWETDLNEAVPGDPRDTTTPLDMLQNLRKTVLGDALRPASREQLARWLLANKTGGKRLRAHLPADWRVGDKTGSGGRGTSNDIGVLWPPGGAPVVVTAYLTETSADANVRDAALAEVGRLAASLIRPG